MYISTCNWVSEGLVWDRTKIFSESPWSQEPEPNVPKAYTDTMKRDNLLGRLWLIYNTMSNVMVSFVAEIWQFNPESQAAWKDVGDSGCSISRLLDVPNGSNKPFHRDAGPSVLKGMRGNKGGSEVISPALGPAIRFHSFPIERAECNRKSGEEREQTSRCVWGENGESLGHWAAKLSF